MPRLKSQLVARRWPETLPSREPVELSGPTRRQAESVLAMLEGHGVEVRLDGDRVRFKSRKTPPLEARRAIEVQGDLVEALLLVQAAEAFE
jgi:hypothetical protein